MELEAMGRVTTDAKIENLFDTERLETGEIRPEDVRNVFVQGALIDTGATTLALPTAMIQQLWLRKITTKTMRTSAGPREAGIYSSVRLTIQDRDCDVRVTEVRDGTPVLIGQIPLEYLDFVVDPNGQRLIGNPEHGGEQMYELY
jgi:predicted aspartyl protease